MLSVSNTFYGPDKCCSDKKEVWEIFFILYVELDTAPTHAQLSPLVPVLAVYFHGQKDLVAVKYTQGWSHELHLLITAFWLAHGLSYSVVSKAFHVHKSPLCRLVHTGVQKGHQRFVKHLSASRPP